MNTARADSAQLAATRSLHGVTAAAGPFAEATVQTQFQGQPFGQFTLAGRTSPGGPVDTVVLTAGHWPTGPGQVVLDGPAGGGGPVVGNTLTVTGLPHAVTLTVVGFANSITNTADGWVAPGRDGRPAVAGHPAGRAAAVPVRQRGHRRTGPRRPGGSHRGTPAGRGDAGRLMARRREPEHRQRRDHGAVRDRVRADRPGHGGAHRGQRGQRRGGRRVLPDRRAEEHRPDPGAGRGGVPEPGRLAGPGRVRARGGGGQRAGHPGAGPVGRRLRRRQPERAVVGVGRRAGRDAGADRAGRARARAARGTAVGHPGHRGGPRPERGPRGNAACTGSRPGCACRGRSAWAWPRRSPGPRAPW